MDTVQSAERVFLDYLEREEHGEPADFENLCRRNPELAVDLRELRSAHAHLIDVAARVGLGAQTSAAPGIVVTAHPGSTPQAEASTETPWSGTIARLSQTRTWSERYEERRQIGRGGMGVIYEVWDRDLRRPLAMKRIRDDGEARGSGAAKLGRFVEEAQVTGQLEHPSIVPVHELGTDAEGRVYFTMKLVEGRNLRDIFELVPQGVEGWTLTRVLGVLLRVAEAVAFAHSKGVIHRDLKPENVMVGSFGEIYVMDWGLARVAGGGAEPASVHTDRHDGRAGSSSALYTVEGQGLGTPAYMPPEQARGKQDEIDARVDIYALGAILYHLLAGRPPYLEPGELVTVKEISRRVIQGPPRPLESSGRPLPEELVAICDKAMAREPAERYATALELAEDLRSYTEGRVVRAHQTGLVVELRKWVRRNRALSTALVLAFVSAVGAGFTSYERVREKGAAAERYRVQEAELSSEREENGRRQLLAEQNHAASAARERGQWHAVIDAMVRARATGPVDLVDVLLREGEAWQALSEGDKAAACIAELEQRTDLGSRDVPLLVLKATHLSASFGRSEECYATARAALDAGVSGADRAFMSALIAPTSAGALQHLDDALAGQPYHRLANDMKTTLLIFSGEFERAAEHCRTFAALYPKDPQPWLGLAMANMMLGRPDEARTAFAEVTQDVQDQKLRTMEALFGILERVATLPPNVFLPGGAGAFLMMGLKNEAADLASEGTDEQGAFAIPSFYCLEAAFGGLLRCIVEDNRDMKPLAAILALASKLLSEPVTAERCVRQALEHHKEGVLYYILAKAHARMPPAPGHEADHRRATREAWLQAAETPSFIPQTRRAARLMLTRCERELVEQHGASDLNEALARRPHEYLAFDDPTDTESIEYAELAIAFGEPGVAYAIVRKTRERAPNDLGLRLAEAKTLVAMKSFAPAIEIYDEILAADPGKEPSKMKRKSVVAAQDKARVGRAEALAGIAETARSLAPPPVDHGAK